jgi:hypothetical protein
MGPGMDEEMMEYGGTEESASERALRHHRLLDLSDAQGVEFKVAEDGRVWVNVDGKCVLRIAKIEYYELDTPGVGVITKV